MSSAPSQSQLIDLAAIGAWLMDTRSRDYSMWSSLMRRDADISNVLTDKGNEDELLRQVYNWSYALLAGGYLYKEGKQEYAQWSQLLLSGLDEELGSEISPHLREVFKLAREMASSIGRTFANKPFRPNGNLYDGSKYTVKIPDKINDQYFVYNAIHEAATFAKSLVGEMKQSRMLSAITILHDTCRHCGEPLRLRKGRSGFFWLCSDYPRDGYDAKYGKGGKCIHYR